MQGLNPERDAEELLKTYWAKEDGQTPVPIDPIAIAGKAGIKVFTAPLIWAVVCQVPSGDRKPARVGPAILAVVRSAGGGRAARAVTLIYEGWVPQDGSSLRLGRRLETSAPTVAGAHSGIAVPYDAAPAATPAPNGM